MSWLYSCRDHRQPVGSGGVRLRWALLELVGVELQRAGVLADGASHVFREALLGGGVYLNRYLHGCLGAAKLSDDGIRDLPQIAEHAYRLQRHSSIETRGDGRANGLRASGCARGTSPPASVWPWLTRRLIRGCHASLLDLVGSDFRLDYDRGGVQHYGRMLSPDETAVTLA